MSNILRYFGLSCIIFVCVAYCLSLHISLSLERERESELLGHPPPRDFGVGKHKKISPKQEPVPNSAQFLHNPPPNGLF